MAVSQTHFTILTADSDAVNGRRLAKTLEAAGYGVLMADDGIHCRTLLKTRQVDVLLVDALLCERLPFALIPWARRSFPELRVVAMSDFAPSFNDRFSDSAHGAELVLPKPVEDADRLLQFLGGLGEKTAFSGAVHGIDIIDYAQFLVHTGKRMALEVADADGGTQGKIFFDRGRIVHAVRGGVEGEEALYGLLCARAGKFSSLQGRAAPKITISRPGEFLLVEAARRRDEARG
jgi:CheY-like chemotaxis protein